MKVDMAVSDEPVPTSVREIRMCRNAFVKGATARPWDGMDPRIVAATRYPLPTVEVPRVVHEAGFGLSYKIDTRGDGVRVLFVKMDSLTGGIWKDINSAGHTLDMDRLALIADLYANPTERVEVTE